MHAGDDLHHRRLAGAVLADQAMDLAGLELEVDVAQRRHTAEGLRDRDHGQAGRGGGGRVLARPGDPLTRFYRICFHLRFKAALILLWKSKINAAWRPAPSREGTGLRL